MSTKGDPFEMIERMFQEMSRQFEEAARTWNHEREGPRRLPTGKAGTMGIDVADRGDEFVVTADLPGFERSEIDLRMLDGTLRIEAAHEEETHEEDETYLRNERRRRAMREEVTLPAPVSEDGIEATLKNGVLTVHLPKADPSEGDGHRIDIE